MTTIAVLMLISGMLPLFASALSKVGGAAYDNNAPRSWLARQEGWRSRADHAQTNLFEGLPLLYAAVLFALYRQADLGVDRAAGCLDRRQADIYRRVRRGLRHCANRGLGIGIAA